MKSRSDIPEDVLQARKEQGKKLDNALYLNTIERDILGLRTAINILMVKEQQLIQMKEDLLAKMR